MKRRIEKTVIGLSLVLGLMALQQPAYSQTARTALETYEEGPVWQMMTFRTAPGKTELHLKNIATAWEHQLKLAVKKGVLIDYKVLTKWSSNPDDWNIMVIEMFPNMASYDTFWKDWAAIDAETVDRPEFLERLASLKTTADTQFLGTVFAREVRLKAQ
jgi:hypothetical protein